MTERRFILALGRRRRRRQAGARACRRIAPEELAIVVNTADDFVHLGLHISPDIDSVLYALADLNDPERGWGLAGETWNFMAALERLGGETWFRLGDRDLATHVLRSRALAAGRTLSDVDRAAGAPARRRAHDRADDRRPGAQRSSRPTKAPLDFQDYFVRRQCQPAFRGVDIRGRRQRAAEQRLPRRARPRATPSSSRRRIRSSASTRSWRCPASPTRCASRGRPVVAVSPIVGGQAVKGPLAKMMRERGLEPSALGVARHYGQPGRRLDRRYARTARSSPRSRRWAAASRSATPSCARSTTSAGWRKMRWNSPSSCLRDRWTDAWSCWAIIPVKSLSHGKSRLSAVLGAEQRAALNRRLFGRVLDGGRRARSAPTASRS